MKISEAIKELAKLQEEVGDQDLLVIADSDSPEDALVQDEFRITVSKLVDDDGNTGEAVPTILVPPYDKDVCLTEGNGLKRGVDKKVLKLIEEAENLILNELHGYGARARMHLLSARDALLQRRYFAEPAIEKLLEPGPLSEISKLIYINGFRVGRNEFIRIDQERSEITFRLQNGPVEEAGLNGCQVDAMIESAWIIIDALNKKFPSSYNRRALFHLELALNRLSDRKRDRENRGVEGRSEI